MINRLTFSGLYIGTYPVDTNPTNTKKVTDLMKVSNVTGVDDFPGACGVQCIDHYVYLYTPENHLSNTDEKRLSKADFRAYDLFEQVKQQVPGFTFKAYYTPMGVRFFQTLLKDGWHFKPTEEKDAVTLINEHLESLGLTQSENEIPLSEFTPLKKKSRC